MNLNEQPVYKKKVLRSLRDFLYESICSSWYRNENSNIIKHIKKHLTKCFLLGKIMLRNNLLFKTKLYTQLC